MNELVFSSCIKAMLLLIVFKLLLVEPDGPAPGMPGAGPLALAFALAAQSVEPAG